MQTIYVVEDEDNIRELVTYALQNADFKVIQFKDGRNLHAHCLKEMPDLIIFRHYAALSRWDQSIRAIKS